MEAQHVHYELSAAKFSWDHPRVYSSASRLTTVTVDKDPYEACVDAHAICVLTGAWRAVRGVMRVSGLASWGCPSTSTRLPAH